MVKTFLVFFLFFGVLGCAHMENNVEKIFVDPQYGMSKAQMLDLLGKPRAIEIFKKPNLTREEFYIYVRKHDSSEEKVPVCLIDNKIVGWGKTFYEDHVSLEDVRIK